MPKSKYHARMLAQLRKTVGKSQAQFAAMIGVSKHTIISVENGRNQLSPKLAKRIQAATGAQILNEKISFEPFNDNPRIVNGQRLSDEVRDFIHKRWYGTGRHDNTYTREDFDQWRKNFYSSTEKTAREQFEKIKIWIEFLFRAAAKPGHAKIRDRFPAVYQSLVDWLNETREMFKLENEIDDILEGEARTVGECGFSITSLLEDPKKAKAQLAEYGYDYNTVKKIFNKRVSNFDWLIIETESRLVWNPFGGNTSIPCKHWKLLKKAKFWVEDWRHSHKRITGKDWDYGPEINEMITKEGIQLPPVNPEMRA